jgi:hypothetical protein
VSVVNVTLVPWIKVISSAELWLAVKSAAVTVLLLPTFVLTEKVPSAAPEGMIGLLVKSS